MSRWSEMGAGVRRHLTFANVAAMIALFVVLGGPAEAARTVKSVYYAVKAKDSQRVGGYKVSAKPRPRTLLPLDRNGKIPRSALPTLTGGPPGPAGPAGPAGADGLDGTAGPRGHAGAPGPAGPEGARGPAGTGTGFVWRGLWSRSPATPYEKDDTVLHDGAAYVATVDGPDVEPGSGSGWDLMAARGATGPEGASGDTGADGPKGDAGPAGPRGETGSPGPTGPSGPRGDKGDKGETGSSGPKGDTGPTGPQGAQGLPGLRGEIGPTGPKGDKGDQGVVGPTGPGGDAGQRGPTGAKGDAGLAGPAGPTGPKGDTGATGTPGPVGPTGPSGADGRSIMWRGTWNALTSYLPRDAVVHQGSAYIATAVSSGATPTAGGVWDLMAAKGDVGATGAPGPQGPAGADGQSFVYRGTWASRTAYAPGDVVFTDGSSYVAKTATTGQDPVSSPLVWGLMALEGAVGPKGEPGAIGPTGPQGPAGPAGPTGPAGPAGPAGLSVGNGASLNHDPNPLLSATPQAAIVTTVTIPDGARLFVQADVEVVKDGTTNTTSAKPVCQGEYAPFGTSTYTKFGQPSQEDIGTAGHRRQILVTGSIVLTAGRYSVRVMCTGNNSYIDDATISVWAATNAP